MIDTTEEHSTKIETTAFPTFTALVRRLGGLWVMMRPFLRRYRWGLILTGVFAAILLIGNRWEEIRTRPTRELYTALDQKNVIVHNVSRLMRSYRFPPVLNRFIPQRDEANDTVHLLFCYTNITRETMELCCRLKSIGQLDFVGREFNPEDLKPFLTHPEIRCLLFRECPKTDEHLVKILESFPGVTSISFDDKTPVTDKTADLLIARKIRVNARAGRTGFSPAAVTKLQSAKLCQ